MPRGIRIKTEFIPLVKQRMLQRGFARQIDLAERIDRSQSVINFFLNGRTVEYLNFHELCQVLDFEVEEIADYEALASVYKEKTQKINNFSPSSSLPLPPSPSRLRISRRGSTIRFSLLCRTCY